ncbi:MAG: mandelate racemase/muconate lactonizing enzyme family protein [Terriglobales bacterium]
MRITNVEPIYVRMQQVKKQCDSGQDALIIKVSTDEGITGIGEVDSAPSAVQGLVNGAFSHTLCCGLKQLLIGEDPFQTEYLFHKMFRNNIYIGHSGILIHAISGVDIALWDIKGKKLGLPIWKLLGGGFHKKLRCYASVLFGDTPEKTYDEASRLRDLGFTAAKFGWGPMGKDAKNDVALVAKARAGLGDDLDLMVDAGLAWDTKTAIQRADAFTPYNPFWLEEPLHPHNYEGYNQLTKASKIRIAAGEEEDSLDDYRRLITEGQCDVIQVDLTRCGGFTGAMKVASLAANYHRPVANHGFTTYINVSAALHWLNSIPNALIVEFASQNNTDLRESLTRQTIKAVGGFLDIPQEPGLGVDLNEDTIGKLRVS